MSTIQALLNPLPDQQFPFTLPAPQISRPDAAPAHKKQKSKGLPRKKGPIRGELRYPPYEERDDELASVHREFRMKPMGSGDIRERPWHVPYNSDKKTFQGLTGRDSLEVFYYQFKLPGQAESEEPWWVMWDYNIGLVRMTHLFKSNGHSKTTIGKAMKANPGLPEISHSITGGATEAQGYWVPFDAAKALAATFCYKIRHVLVPLFGPDFPSLCIHPHERTRFNRMIIDRVVIQRATQTANYYRGLELRSSPFTTNTTNTTNTPSPSRPTSSSGGSFVARKKAIPRSRKHASSLSSSTTGTVSSGYASGSGSGYGSGIDEYSDAYCVSPVSVGSYRGGNAFTPVNTPRSVNVYTSSASGTGTTTRTGIPTPQDLLASISARVNTGTNTDEASNSTGTSSSPSPGTSTDEETSSPSTAYSEISSGSWSDYSFVDVDKDDREYNNSPTSEPMPMRTNRKRKADGNVLLAKEVKAAHALLSLHMQDASESECGGEGEGERVSPPASSSSLVGVYQQQQQTYCQGQSRKRRRASA